MEETDRKVLGLPTDEKDRVQFLEEKVNELERLLKKVAEILQIHSKEIYKRPNIDDLWTMCKPNN